jgi:microcystin-dependent protein
MADPFLGQITQVAFQFAPVDYSWCDGQTIQLQQNPGLYSLLGVRFGGDMRTYFKLPDLRGRTPVYPDPVNGVNLGSVFGWEEVTLAEHELPEHNHGFMATTTNGASFNPTGRVLATAVDSSKAAHMIYGPAENKSMVQLNPDMLGSNGGAPHANMQPSLVIGFAIAVSGEYPSRGD